MAGEGTGVQSAVWYMHSSSHCFACVCVCVHACVRERERDLAACLVSAESIMEKKTVESEILIT